VNPDDLDLARLRFKVTDFALTPSVAVGRLASTAAAADCPACGAASRRVHSHYTRTVADLPGHGRPVVLRLVVRRFRCSSPECPRVVFCERLPGLAGPRSRSTPRLAGLHRLVGLALGGEPGSRLADDLAVPTSPDTILRRVKDAEIEPHPPARFVGIADWAFRKGHTYGTVVVDLERGRVLDLLPDREAATVERWLKAHPGVEVVTRDRSAAYAKGVGNGAPGATQVADRWHLLKNLREAVEGLFERLADTVKGACAESPATSTAQLPVPPAGVAAPTGGAECPDAGARPDPREGAFRQAGSLHAQGVPIRDVAARLGLSRNTVRRYLRTGRLPDRRRGGPAANKLSAHTAWIDRRIAEGVACAARLHRELAGRGVRVSPATVRRAVAGRLVAAGRQARPGRGSAPPPPVPTPRRLSFEWVRRPDRREPDAHDRLERARAASAELGEGLGLGLADEFADLVRQRATTTFDDWLARAGQSSCGELRRFAEGVRQDEAAVRAGVGTRWSNGPVEGHVNRLKVIKRQMYGRAGLDLLRRRVVNSA